MFADRFQQDVFEAIEANQGFEGGRVGAVDFATISAAIAEADKVIQQFKPLIESWTPDQYDIYVNMVAAAIHAIATELSKHDAS